MSDRTRIAAAVSKGGNARLERPTRATGLKRHWAIESALAPHLQALAKRPANKIIPPRIVVDRETGEHILKRIRTLVGKETQGDRFVARTLGAKLGLS